MFGRAVQRQETIFCFERKIRKMAPGKADGKECGEKNIPEPGSESEMRLELRIEWRGKRVIVNKRAGG